MEFSYYYDQGPGESDRFVPAPVAEVTLEATDTSSAYVEDLATAKRSSRITPIDLSRFARKKQQYHVGEIRGPNVNRPTLPEPVRGVQVDKLPEAIDPRIGQEKAKIVSGLLASSLAPGTVRNYESTIKRFQDYCAVNSLDFDNFDYTIVLDWILHLEKDKAPFSFVKNVKPALTFLEDNLGRNVSVWNSRLTRILNGLIRRAAVERKPPRKATILLVEILKQLIDKYVTPHKLSIHSIDAWVFRAIFKDLLKFHTLCRFNDVQNLRACDFNDEGSHITVTFRSAKNDQLHMGNTNVLPYTGTDYCSATLIRMYFERMGFKFASEF